MINNKGISYQGGGSYVDPRVGSEGQDYNQRVLGALNQQRMGQGYKYSLPEDYLKEYSHSQIDSLIQANDLAQLLNPQPKDMEDDGNSIMEDVQEVR